MADFPKRLDEMLKDVEALKSALPDLPEQALKNLNEAIAKYKAWRNRALEDLLKLLESDSADESARNWTYFCEAARANAPEYFEDALKNVQMSKESGVKTSYWLITLMCNESKFFEELGKANAAEVRDYLVKNRESLRSYTQTLDQKWRAIVDEGNKLQSEEKKLYDEMLSMTNRILEEFKNADRTAQEKIRYVGQFPLIAVEKLAGAAADIAGLPDGVGEAAEKAAEYLREKNQAWLEGNRALQGRAANYRSLVQAERGGVLPLFRDTRREVYEYWDKNNIERARDWMKKFQESLESRWIGACPTAGQRDDAKEFYKAAFERVERHLKTVETIAKEFEERWNGVFKGALAPKTIDELMEKDSWRVNADTLVSIHTPAVVKELLDKLDGYLEGFNNPMSKLADMVRDLPEPSRKQAQEAMELAKKRVEESVRARIQSFRSEVGASLRWFEPDEIRKTLGRDELESFLSSLP